MNSSNHDFLHPNFSESETTEMRSLIKEIEVLRAKTESLSPEQWQAGLERFSPARLLTSGSLLRGDSEGWQAANAYASNKVAQDLTPTAQDIFQLNAHLLSKPTAEIRNQDVYIGPFKAMDSQDLPSAFEYFCDQILPLEKHEHPLLAAALSRFGLVSLHPFADANGRTSVILADWLLLVSGYLPLGFTTRTDGIIASFSNHRPSATAANAVLKTLINVRTSYQLVLGHDPHL